MRPRRFRRLAGDVLFAALVVGSAAAGATAQASGAELAVRAIETVATGPESPIRVQLTVRNPGSATLAGVRVTGSVYRRIVSRFAFRQAMEEGPVGPVVSTFDPVALDSLPPTASRTLELRATAAELGFGRTAQQGVYPLRITVETGGEVTDEVVTSAVAAPATIEEPLRFSLLVPIDQAPGLLADGSYDSRLPQALALGGGLDHLTRDLQTQPGAAVTIAPSGYLLEQAVDMADGYRLAPGRDGVARDVPAADPTARNAAAFLGRLREIAGRPEVEELALPYGPADLVGLVRSGLGMEVGRELAEGAGAVERVTGQPTVPGVLVPPDGLDDATLDVIDADGVTSVVLDEQLLALGEALPTTPPPVRGLTAGGSVLVPDPFLDAVLQQPSEHGGAVDAQRVLAETAAVYFERPFARTPRGLLLMTPDAWEPPDGLLAALLAGMRSASWLRPLTVSGLQREIEPAQEVDLAYPEAARRRELDAAYLRQLREARAALGSLAAVLPEGDRTAGRFDRMLLAAAAVWYREGPMHAEGAARAALVRQTVEATYGAVRVVEEQPVTLTSIEDQQMPVTVVSQATVPLRVRVRLEATPIAFEQGNTQIVVLEPGVPTTLTFAVRVITPGGTFAANVFVEDPEGGRPLAQGSIQVRSAAYSVVALVVTAGAGVFLLAWWVREALRQRRAKAAAV